MRRTGFLLFLVFFCACCPSLSSSSSSSSPNVILLLIDDAGHDDLFSSRLPLHLPRFSTLAEEGVLFTRGLLAAPQCSPSRAALLTGMYQNRFGHESNTEFLAALSLNSTRIIPQYLPSHYRSAMFGKWNLGDIPNSPLKHGFHEMYLYRDCEVKHGTVASLRKKPKTPNYPESIDRRYCNSIMFQRASNFVSSAQAPFFMYLAPLSPHPPFIYPPTYDAVFDNISTSINITRRKVMTMMYELDDGLGTVLSALKSRSIMNNTLIVALSDNGAPNIFGSSEFPNYPFRGFKGDLWEGGIRSKMIAHWPDVIKPNQVVHTPVSSLDVLPTIIDAINSHSNASSKNQPRLSLLDGSSLLPLVDTIWPNSTSSEFPSHRVLYWRFNATCRAIQRALLQYPFKWIKVGEAKHAEVGLFDVSTDVNESSNLAVGFPHLATALERLHLLWENTLPPIRGRMSLLEEVSRRRECAKRQEIVARNKLRRRKNAE